MLEDYEEYDTAFSLPSVANRGPVAFAAPAVLFDAPAAGIGAFSSSSNVGAISAGLLLQISLIFYQLYFNNFEELQF